LGIDAPAGKGDLAGVVVEVWRTPREQGVAARRDSRGTVRGGDVVEHVEEHEPAGPPHHERLPAREPRPAGPAFDESSELIASGKLCTAWGHGRGHRAIVARVATHPRKGRLGADGRPVRRGATTGNLASSNADRPAGEMALKTTSTPSAAV